MSAKRGIPVREVPWERLGAREREILEILYARGEATVAEVLEALADPPSYSATRGMLALLEQKGYVRHRQEALRYVYSATVSAVKTRGAALRKLVDTFFGGSPERAVATLLQLPEGDTGDLTLAELRKAVLDAKREGR